MILLEKIVIKTHSHFHLMKSPSQDGSKPHVLCFYSKGSQPHGKVNPVPSGQESLWGVHYFAHQMWIVAPFSFKRHFS